MIRLIKRIGFILFWELSLLLALFIIDPAYYLSWLIFCLISFFFLIYFSYKIILTKKSEKKLEKLFIQYKGYSKTEQDILTKSSLLNFSCPSCKHETNFKEFLIEEKCPKCDSKLWTTQINSKDSEYFSFYDKMQKVKKFMSHLTYRKKNKLKKLLFYHDSE